MKSIFVIIFVLISITACEYSKIVPNKASVLDRFTKEEYLSDLSQLTRELKAKHPRMHDFVSQDSFDILVGQAEKSITDNMNLGEFIWLCRSISAKVACGHSFVPTLSKKFIMPDSFLFPMKVQYIGDSLFVIDPLENNDHLKAGNVISHINGIDVRDIREGIKQHISADGNNNSFKELYVNSNLNFFFAYQFAFPMEYRLNYIDDLGSEKEIVLKQSNDLIEFEVDLVNCRDNLCFDIDEKCQTAVMTIRSFVYYNQDLKKFKRFIDESFMKMREENIEHLILDIRNNGGGDPYAASYLLGHLIQRNYSYYEKGTSEGYLDLQQEIKYNTNGFAGDLIIITNGKCFSTSGHFMSLIKYYQIGTIVGEETGATFTCNANTQEIRLKNTGISSYIATGTYRTIASNLDERRGIVPDHIISHTLHDMINKKDSQMEFAKNLICSN